MTDDTRTDEDKYPDRWAHFGYLYHRDDPKSHRQSHEVEQFHDDMMEDLRNQWARDDDNSISEEPKKRPLVDGRGMFGVRV